MAQKSLFIASLTFLISFLSSAQNIRPIRDDVGFCWDWNQMKRLVDFLDSVVVNSVQVSDLVAAISPHDDYLYAGRVYYPLFKSLRTREAVIFGVTHGAVRREIGDPQKILLLDEFDQWTGLSRTIRISPLRDLIKKELDPADYRIDNKAHRLEHSIEALLPFLQYYNPDIIITPIMITAMPFDRMDTLSGRLADVISKYIDEKSLIPGKDIVFLMSADANHYGDDFNNSPFGVDESSHRKGTENDKRIAKDYLGGAVKPTNIEKLTKELTSVLWCGRYSIPFGLLCSQKIVRNTMKKSLRGEILLYSDTYSEGTLPIKKTGMGTTAPFSLKHWVGFFSAEFFIAK